MVVVVGAETVDVMVVGGMDEMVIGWVVILPGLLGRLDGGGGIKNPLDPTPEKDCEEEKEKAEEEEGEEEEEEEEEGEEEAEEEAEEEKEEEEEEEDRVLVSEAVDVGIVVSSGIVEVVVVTTFFEGGGNLTTEAPTRVGGAEARAETNDIGDSSVETIGEEPGGPRGGIGGGESFISCPFNEKFDEFSIS
jgi:hypothetical protein